MFATGKNELLLRDLLAAKLQRTLQLEPPFRIDREWRKHDLSLMNGQHPVAVIEGKSWIHANAANANKLLHSEKGIRQSLEADIAKMMKTKDDFPQMLTFASTVVFSIDTSGRKDDVSEAVKYSNEHRRGIEKFGSLEALREKSHSQLTDMMKSYGSVDMFELSVGTYQGMAAAVDFYVTEIR
jgi:trimethylamine:corrinoid methyltransferase-like protein